MRIMLDDMEYLFGQLVSAVPFVSPPNLLPMSSLLPGKSRVWNEEGLDAVQALFINS